MDLIGYTRVSTEDQVTDGHGLDSQRRLIERWADGNDHRIVRWASDVKTGARIGPGLADVLESLRLGEAEGIVVSKVDRISRSFVNFGSILDRSIAQGWSLIVLDPPMDLSSPFGRAMGRILATFAEFEREQIGDRVRSGLAAAKDRGVKLGADRLVPDETVAVIRELRAEGLGYERISQRLNELGLPAAKANRWRASSVRWILESRAAA